MRARWSALVAVSVIAVGALPLTSCGLITTRCVSGQYSIAQSAEGSATPLLAVEQWAIENTAVSSAPLSGWTEVSHDATTYTLKSGGTKVTVWQLPNGNWIVTSYQSCH